MRWRLHKEGGVLFGVVFSFFLRPQCDDSYGGLQVLDATDQVCCEADLCPGLDSCLQ